MRLCAQTLTLAAPSFTSAAEAIVLMRREGRAGICQLRRRDERARTTDSDAVVGLARVSTRPQVRLCDGSHAAAPPSARLASGGIRSVAEAQTSCVRAASVHVSRTQWPLARLVVRAGGEAPSESLQGEGEARKKRRLARRCLRWEGADPQLEAAGRPEARLAKHPSFCAHPLPHRRVSLRRGPPARSHN